MVCFAQSEVTGRITSNGTAVSDVNVSLEKTSLSTVTDANGEFVFKNISAGIYELKVSGVNYVTKKIKITVDNNPRLIQIELKPINRVLDEVQINEHRKQTGVATRTLTPLKDIPQSIQVVGQQQLKDQQALYIDDVLKNVAGVNNSSPYGNFNYRGFDTGLQEIMFNGIKGSPFPEGVSPMLSNVEAVEVIHGPTAILYGQGALGGNINIITKQPKKDLAVNVSAGAGNLNLYRAMADVAGSLNQNRSLYAVASVGYQDGGASLERFTKRNLQLYGAIRWDLAPKTYLQLTATYLNDRQTRNYAPAIPIVKDDLYALPVDFNFSGNDAYYKGSSYQFQLEGHHEFNSNWSAHLLSNFSRSGSDRYEYSASGFYNPASTGIERYFTSQQIYSPSISINPYINGKIKTGPFQHTLSTGFNADFRRNNYPNGFKQYSANTLFLNQPDYGAFDPAQQTLYYLSTKETFVYNIFGAYLQDQVELSAKLKMLLGLRYNNYFSRYEVPSITYDGVNFDTYNEYPEVTAVFIPRAGLVYQPFSHSSFYIDYNQGFSPQYNNAKIYGGPFPPETSNNYELGYKGSFMDDKFTAGLAWYRLDKSNVLTNALDPTNTLLQRAIGQVRSQGIELSVAGKLGSGWSLLANYANNSTKVRKSNKPAEIGQVFGNSPRQMANLWASYQFGIGALRGLQLGAGPRYTDSRFIGVRKLDAEVLELPSYTVVDAMAGYQFKNYKIQFNINNLFNEKYALNGSYNVYVPGLPRNFLFTLAYSFKKGSL